MRRLALAAILILLPQAAQGTTRHLAGGAPSVDALVARLVRALEANDAAALRRLRVSRAEYLDIVVPGNVEPGTPLRTLPAAKVGYFWDILDEKSAFAERALLAEFGGRRWRVVRVDLPPEPHRFAGFTSHGRLRVVVADAGGTEHDLRVGSVIHRDGMFKLVSLVRD